MNALVNTLEKTTNKETTLSLPIQLKAALPLSAKLAQQISQHRQTVQNILNGTDKRLMVITGFLLLKRERSHSTHPLFLLIKSILLR